MWWIKKAGVSPRGVLSLDCMRKRFSRFKRTKRFKRFKRFNGDGAAHNTMEAPRSKIERYPKVVFKSPVTSPQSLEAPNP